MPQIIPRLACVAIGVVLAYAAYTDYKRRIIPNIVPILILAFGCFTTVGWVNKLLSLVAIVLILMFCTKVLGQKSGGGDLKLYGSLSFAIGIQGFALTLGITFVLCFITQLIRGRLKKKGDLLPMAVFIFPAYLLLMFFIL